MSGDGEWKSGGLFTGWCCCCNSSEGACLNSIYGSCFPCCAIASAKSSFDGSEFCFNLVCFGCSPGLVRNYMRQGYEIKGRVGLSDCCIASTFPCCVITQLLNEVRVRGPKLVSIPDQNASPWLAPTKDWSCLGDPCDFFCTFLTCPCEVANVYTQLSGAPFWFAMCPGSPCW